MEHEPIGTIEHEIDQSQTSVDVVNRQRQLDYSRHPLVCGQPYMVEDVRIELLQDIDTSSSGVCGKNQHLFQLIIIFLYQ